MISLGEQRRRREYTDALVQESLRSGDEGVLLALRTAIERGLHSSAMDSLFEAKRRKENDINKVCSRHYSDFLVSVAEMLKMKSSAAELKEMVRGIHYDFARTGEELVTVLSDLERVTKEKDNTRRVLKAIGDCREIATRMLEARKQIESNDHYSAMRSLESLQSELVLLKSHPQLSALMVCLQIWLPIGKSRLLDFVKLDANEVLFKLRVDLSRQIGETLLRKKAKQVVEENLLNMSLSKNNKRNRVKITQLSSTISSIYVETCDDFMKFSQWINPNEFDSVIPLNFMEAPSEEGLRNLIDIHAQLAPIFKSIYMHKVLNETSSFNQDYRSRRDEILPLFYEEAEEMASNMGLTTVMPSLMAKVVGFFFVESLVRFSGNFSAHLANKSSGVDSESKRASRATDTNKNNLNSANNSNFANAQKPDITLDSCFSGSELAGIWEKNVGYLYTITTRNSDSFSSPEQLLQLKEDILLMIELLSDEVFQSILRVSGLYEIVRLLWGKFEKCQNYYITEHFKIILEDCVFQSMFVSSEEVYSRELKPFNLHLMHSLEQVSNNTFESSSKKDRGGQTAHRASLHETLDALESDLSIGISNSHETVDDSNSNETGSTKLNFSPQTFPFSEAVPKIFREIFLLITRYLLFAAKNPFLGSRGESICNSLQLAFTTISKIFHDELTSGGNDTPLSKAVQISIDCFVIHNNLGVVNTAMERFLANFHWFECINYHLPSCIQAAKRELLKVSLDAQDIIVELLSAKIDDLLSSLIFIDFTPSSFSDRHDGSENNVNILTVINQTQSHEVIDQMIEFLQITFMCLTHLPSSAREVTHFTCCSKISQDIINFVTTSNKVTAINLFALFALEKDVFKLEAFADSLGTPHLKQCFADFRDLISAAIRVVKLHMTPNELNSLIDNPDIRSTMYPKLDMIKLAAIVEKIVPLTGPMANSLPKIDKSNLKQIVKKIRTKFK